MDLAACWRDEEVGMVDRMSLTQQPVGQANGMAPQGYADLLAEIKQRIRSAQVRAVRAANTEVLHLYWSVGHDILLRQNQQGWGAKVI
ncbi:MAG: DUF1016 N-terminal domain-containing protein, partial [Propionibacteriaceae bacterium]|nr:DUF1016 N-terminal domain-containing protein [Propionibacteriaceae bacterium]